MKSLSKKISNISTIDLFLYFKKFGPGKSNFSSFKSLFTHLEVIYLTGVAVSLGSDIAIIPSPIKKRPGVRLDI